MQNCSQFAAQSIFELIINRFTHMYYERVWKRDTLSLSRSVYFYAIIARIQFGNINYRIELMNANQNGVHHRNHLFGIKFSINHEILNPALNRKMANVQSSLTPFWKIEYTEHFWILFFLVVKDMLAWFRFAFASVQKFQLIRYSLDERKRSTNNLQHIVCHF